MGIMAQFEFHHRHGIILNYNKKIEAQKGGNLKPKVAGILSGEWRPRSETTTADLGQYISR